MPNTNDLTQVLTVSLADHSKTKSLAYNGLRSIEHSCSEENWRNEWVATINNISDDSA